MTRGIPKDTSVKRRLVHRLKIVRGHLEKVLGMVEEDKYCVDIVHQSIAIQSALKEVDKIILENHMKTCVADSIRKGNSKEVIEEVIKVFDKK
jgi:DNA-binding FrmR family transcriptional regulator